MDAEPQFLHPVATTSEQPNFQNEEGTNPQNEIFNPG